MSAMDRLLLASIHWASARVPSFIISIITLIKVPLLVAFHGRCMSNSKLLPLLHKFLSHLLPFLHRDGPVLDSVNNQIEHSSWQPPKPCTRDPDLMRPPIFTLARYHSRTHCPPIWIDEMQHQKSQMSRFCVVL